MTSSRDMILAAVRANAPSPAIPMPQVPTFDRDGPSLLERFRAGFELLGGTFVDYVPGTDLTAKIGELFPQAKVICSATAEVTGNKSLQEIKLPADLDDVDGFVALMAQYASLGVGAVEIMPTGDPIAFVTQIGDRIVPALAQLG